MAASEWEKPVAEAIAEKFLSVDGVKQAVALGADNLTRLPGVLVLAPEFELLERTGAHWLWQAIYPAYLIAPVLRTPRLTNNLLVGIVGRSRMAFGLSALNLGLSYVQDSILSAGNPELFVLAGDDELPAYRFTIVTKVREAISPTVA